MLDTTERLLISTLVALVALDWLLAVGGLVRNPLIFVGGSP